jgi:tetratricopeptide (TPR) repeat protein
MRSRLRGAFALPLLVALLTALPFLRVLRNGFVDWDDNTAIILNPGIRGLGWTQLVPMFTDFNSLYRPITWLTFGADYVVWGLNPAGFHLTSLAFHIANAVLIYYVALRLLRRGASENAVYIPFAAASAALLWSLHPLRVEPVAWAASRSDIVAAFFIFIALLFYLRAVGGAAYSKWMIGSWLAYVVSLLAKPSGMLFPIVLLAIDGYPLRRMKPANARRVWLEKVPFFISSCAAALMSVVAKRQVDAISDSNILANLPLAVYATGIYLSKTVLPITLSPFYPIPDKSEVLSWPLVLFPVLVIALTVAVVMIRRSWPAAPAAWLCYVALLLPSSGIVRYGPQLVADRYTYLPDAVLAVSAGALFLCLYRRHPRLLLPSAVLTAMFLSVLGVLSWRQTYFWRDSETFYRRAIAVAPRSIVARHNLAEVLLAAGRGDKAAELYRSALAIRDYPEGHVDLGMILTQQGRIDEAIRQYREAIRIDGALLQPRQNLALLFIREGRLDEAEKEYREALKINPTFVEAHNNLGLILASRGRLVEATAEYRQAIRFKPNFAMAHANLGEALLSQGRRDDAVVEFERALSLDPNLSSARRGLESARASLPKAN